MRLSRFLLPVSALLVTACALDEGPTVNSRPPLAAVRFIHAIADEGPIDARMIDQAQWSSYAIGINFRQSGHFMATEAGTRPVRIFRHSNVIDSIALLVEQDVNIVAGQNVTLLLTGSVQAGTARIEVIPDAVPDSVTGQIHIRAVNATGAAADAQWQDAGGAGAATSVGSLGTSGYTARSTDSVAVLFTGAPLAAAPKGTLVNNGIGATAGYSSSGSALSAYLFPASVPGSRAPQTPAAFGQPAVVWFVDRVPAPPR